MATSETKATQEYAVAVEFKGQGKGYVARQFDCNEDEYGNHHAWTGDVAKAKRWRTRYGANVNAARYERHNPAARTNVVRVVQTAKQI